jgi:hypothetical protein
MLILNTLHEKFGGGFPSIPTEREKKMKKKIVLLFVVLLLTGLLASLAFAAEECKGKVSGVATDKVTIVLEGAMPAWLKAGATVTAGNGAPRVISVKGNEVVLRFSKAKAKNMKVDSPISLQESDGDELQGC